MSGRPPGGGGNGPVIAFFIMMAALVVVGLVSWNSGFNAGQHAAVPCPAVTR